MFDKIVEQLLREAAARGEFDDLPNKGKPIDLTAYFDTPEHIRVAQSVLKNAGILPREAELLQEIAALKEQLSAGPDQATRVRLEKNLREKQLQFNLAMELQRRQSK